MRKRRFVCDFARKIHCGNQIFEPHKTFHSWITLKGSSVRWKGAPYFFWQFHKSLMKVLFGTELFLKLFKWKKVFFCAKILFLVWIRAQKGEKGTLWRKKKWCQTRYDHFPIQKTCVSQHHDAVQFLIRIMYATATSQMSGLSCNTSDATHFNQA